MIADQAYEVLPAWIRKAMETASVSFLRPKMRAHFSQFVSPDDLVFDVGANMGHLTQVFLGLGARVICVEPHPDCVKALKKKFSKNKKATIVAKGLNSQKGKLTLFTSQKAHSLSTFSDKWRTKGRFRKRGLDQKRKVPVTTLDALIDRYGRPEFCKIDVEGFELPVLKGLSQPTPFLSFEFVEEFLDEAKACVGYLESLGEVKFNYSLYNTYHFFSNNWLSPDRLFSKLELLRGLFLCGDIYARFS